MVKIATTDVQDRQTLQQELALAVKTMQDAGDPRATKMSQLMRDVVERGDYSAFPPEARESLERIKALDAQTQRIIDTQFEPARARASRANNIPLIWLGAALGLATYLTWGMSLLPQVGIMAASSGAGLLAGRFATRNAVKEADTELETIRAKALDSEAQAQKERQGLLANSKGYAKEVVSNVDQSNAPSPTHAGAVRKAPSISELAAPGNAITSHVEAIQAPDNAEPGCRR